VAGLVQTGGRQTRPPSRSSAIDLQLSVSRPPEELTVALRRVGGTRSVLAENASVFAMERSNAGIHY
jgi:hypothetical protein